MGGKVATAGLATAFLVLTAWPAVSFRLFDGGRRSSRRQGKKRWDFPLPHYNDKSAPNSDNYGLKTTPQGSPGASLPTKVEKDDEEFQPIPALKLDYDTAVAASDEEDNTTLATTPPPTVAPLAAENVAPARMGCFEFHTAMPTLNDWENGAFLGWRVENELGPPRLTYSHEVSNGEQHVPLFLNHFGCFNANYTADVRVEADSKAGFVLRRVVGGNEEPYSVTIDGEEKWVALAVDHGPPLGEEVVAKKRNAKIFPGGLYNLQVVDRGTDGEIEVYLNGKEMIAHEVEVAHHPGGFGLLVEKGGAVFSDVGVHPL